MKIEIVNEEGHLIGRKKRNFFQRWWDAVLEDWAYLRRTGEAVPFACFSIATILMFIYGMVRG